MIYLYINVDKIAYFKNIQLTARWLYLTSMTLQNIEFVEKYIYKNI